jgi:UDP-N-acetylmuramate--alanine ligase
MLGRTKKIHFVGIGGIGMSGIAELLINQGFEISGSDMQATPITEHLKQKGATIIKGHDPKVLQEVDCLVKSSAVHDDNPEIASALAQKIPVIRRAEMLAEIMRMSYGIGIAGTHGKTSTTSMVGMILAAANLEPTVIVGGIVKNFGSNNLLGSGKYIVVEADEFDRSFLSLSPIIAGITNIEADHLDCYTNLQNVKNAFIEYSNKVPFFGSVIACLDDPGVQSIIPEIKKEVITYGLSKQANVQAVNIKLKNFTSTFDVLFNRYKLGTITLNVMGQHNILNALLATAVGIELNLSFEAIQKGLSDYNGVYRRFEFKGETNGIQVYDDYAHHPTEIVATLKGVRENTEKRVIAVFQPHLFSRTRDFHQEFGRAFYYSDILVVAPIYPAREKPIEGVTGKLIADAAIQAGHQQVINVESNDDIVKTLESIVVKDDIIITLGAGNINHFGEEFLAKKEK